MPPRATNQQTTARLAWRVANVAASHAEIDIFDVIGEDPWFGGGVSAADFVQQLRALDVATITVNINSPGGYVDDALAMYDALQQHAAEVTARIITAYSAASFVAQAADKRLITRNGKVFIHDAQGFGRGNAADMRTLADLLDKESENIADIYAQRAGGTVTEWRDRMRANDGVGTWYRGQEAMDVGLVDEVVEAPVRNVGSLRVAAHQVEPDPTDVDPELFKQFTARGYEKPLPTDISRLIERNLTKEATLHA